MLLREYNNLLGCQHTRYSHTTWNVDYLPPLLHVLGCLDDAATATPPGVRVQCCRWLHMSRLQRNLEIHVKCLHSGGHALRHGLVDLTKQGARA